MMRKYQYLALLLFFTSPGWAQITIGPKAGYNMAAQFKSNFTVPKFDWAFGAAVNIPVTRSISVQGELLLTKKGYREEFKGNEIFDDLTSAYFEIPAMAKYSIFGVNWGYYFMGGVYWGYWTKGEYESSIDGANIITEEYQFQDDYDADGFKDNRSDFGLALESGVTYDNLGSGVLALGLRYSHGLIATNEYQTPPADVVYKTNKVLTLSITYFLYL